MRLKMILFAFAFSLIQMDAHSQDSGEACANINSDSRRLECYDLIFRQERLSAPRTGTGKWQTTEDVSLLDDSRKVILQLKSENTSPDRFGGGEYSYLLIACRENTTSVWMTFAGHFMSSDAGDGRVTYRIDSNDARTKDFYESNNNSSLGLWRGASSIPFIKELLGGERLVVRATPFSESSVTATYDIRGLEAAVQPLREACHW